MNNLIKGLCLGLFVLVVANCGGGGGGGGGAGATVDDTKGAITGDAVTIAYSNLPGDAKKVYWSSSYGNIFYPTSNPKCVNGLAQADADDSTVSDRISEMKSLLNAGKIINGTAEKTDSFLPLITITFSDNTTATYALGDASEVAKTEQTLSNANDIVDFFLDLQDELDEKQKYYCPGKGQEVPTI